MDKQEQMKIPVCEFRRNFKKEKKQNAKQEKKEKEDKNQKVIFDDDDVDDVDESEYIFKNYLLDLIEKVNEIVYYAEKKIYQNTINIEENKHCFDDIRYIFETYVNPVEENIKDFDENMRILFDILKDMKTKSVDEIRKEDNVNEDEEESNESYEKKEDKDEDKEVFNRLNNLEINVMMLKNYDIFTRIMELSFKRIEIEK